MVALEVRLYSIDLSVFLRFFVSRRQRHVWRWLTRQHIVVTAFKLRAYRYTQSIFAGPIYLPKKSLPEIARAVADFTQRSHDAKLGMFLYVLKKQLLQSIGISQDMLVVHAFDAHGEEHGRSDEGFGWALKLEGAVDRTKPMNLKAVADLQGKTGSVSFIRKVPLTHHDISIHRTRQGTDKFLLVSVGYTGDD